MELTCRDVTKVYGKETVLDTISMTLYSGELVGLIGSNGAGKSTLIKLITTLIKPTSGELLLDGASIVKKPDILRRVVGYLPQQVPVYPHLSAIEFLKYMATVKGIPRKDAANQIPILLERLHLGDVGKKPLGTFSGGMRQRVGIAVALLGDPQIIVADEPTTGLDPQERVTLRNLLSELATGRIVLLSTHIVSDVEAVAGRILLLHEGHLLYNGVPADVLRAAHDRVWEYTLPPGQMPSADITVSSLVQTTEGVYVRAVALAPPVPNARRAEATLEDACLSVLKGGGLQ